jgi:hypothetical protein
MKLKNLYVVLFQYEMSDGIREGLVFGADKYGNEIPCFFTKKDELEFHLPCIKKTAKEKGVKIKVLKFLRGEFLEEYE